MKLDKDAMLLYAVTDRAWTKEKTLCEQAEAALKGGITCLQLREKELDSKAFLAEALELKELCGAYNVPFIINDNVDIAIKCEADGIHVGQHDMNIIDVRKAVGSNMAVGISVQTVSQAIEAEKYGADYLGAGAVFSTDTKPDADYVPYDELCGICRSVSIPIVAIGGINKNNIMNLSGSGIDGVALVSAIFSADDIESECRELKKISKQMLLA